MSKDDQFFLWIFGMFCGVCAIGLIATSLAEVFGHDAELRALRAAVEMYQGVGR